MVYGQLGPGTTIADRYELLTLLGEGGMGQVWKARHVRLDSFVAVKFLHASGNDRNNFRDRFQREAQLAASVKHRNVVTIIDYGETPDGVPYMVMDYLEGEPLTRYVRGAFPTEDIVHLVATAMRGLVAVHAAGIVHRDLKPDNVFLVRDASGLYPKLLDFGISRQTDRSQGKRSAVTTQQGVLLGTPAYMSPEQARGLKDVDHRTDIYSMGVLLYEALAGQLPFDDEHVGDLMVQVIRGEVRPLHELSPTLPRALCDVVMKAMARDRDERFQTAEEMRLALIASVGGERSLMLSERPTPPPGTVALPPSIATLDVPRSLAGSMNEPFQSIVGARASNVDTAAAASPSAVESRTLDGTSVDVVITPGARSRTWMLLAAALVIALGVGWLVLDRDEPVAAPMTVAPELSAKPAAIASTPQAVPSVTPAAAPAQPAPTPTPPAAQSAPVAPVASATPADTHETKRPRRAATNNSKRPVKTTKSSKILTELDY